MPEDEAMDTVKSVCEIYDEAGRSPPCPTGPLHLSVFLTASRVAVLHRYSLTKVSTGILGRRTARFSPVFYSSPRPVWLYPNILVTALAVVRL